MRTDIVLGLALLAGACVDQTGITPNARTVVIHAVLDASANDQFVVVQTTTGLESQQRDATGATVIITTPSGGTVVAEQVQDTGAVTKTGVLPPVSTRYKFSFSRIGAIVPGGTYRLHVLVPDGREASGVTTVPSVDPISIVSPLPDFDYARDTLSLAWHASKGASAFEVYIESPRSSFSMFADTTASVPGRVDDSNGRPAFWPGLTHRVVVSAVDANYYDYYRRTSDFFTGRGIITHLDGAVGVFGSIVPVALYSFVVR